MIRRVSELEVLMLNLRNATVLLSVFVALACRALDQSDHSADVKAIRAVLDAHGEAWTRGEAVAAVATLTDDADWVGGDGQTLEGKAAILAMHEKMLAGPAKGTRHSHPGTPNIRFIRSDVAIVDGNSEMSGFRDENGKQLPAGYSRYAAVFVKQEGKWLVTAFRSLPQVKVNRID